MVPGGSAWALQRLIVIVAGAVLSHNAHKAVDIVHKRIFVRSCEHMAQGDGEEAGCVHVCENVILLCNSCNARTRVVAE